MKPILTFAVAAILAAPALAGPCKENRNDRIKCKPDDATRLGAAAVEGNIRKHADGTCHLIKAAPGQTAGQRVPCPH